MEDQTLQAINQASQFIPVGCEFMYYTLLSIIGASWTVIAILALYIKHLISQYHKVTSKGIDVMDYLSRK